MGNKDLLAKEEQNLKVRRKLPLNLKCNNNTVTTVMCMQRNVLSPPPSIFEIQTSKAIWILSSTPLLPFSHVGEAFYGKTRLFYPLVRCLPCPLQVKPKTSFDIDFLRISELNPPITFEAISAMFDIQLRQICPF